MVWGKIDDKLHGSVKWRRATKGARSLWTTALSWCSDQENDGRVPADLLGYLDGTKAEAACLVKVGLWEVVDAGWQFHDWEHYNPDGASQKAKRAAESDGGREGNHVRWHVRRKLFVPDCEFCQASGTRSGPDQVPESGANPPDPTRPDPTRNSVRRAPAVGEGRPDEQAPPDDTELSPNNILASYGMSAAERRDFLAHLKADPGVRSIPGLITGMHRKGTLRARIDEWREIQALPTKTPTDRQMQILRGEMAKAQANDAQRGQVIPLRQLEGGQP
ncbi:hypothetical protein [Isoptericola sp. NPDC055881]